MTDAIFTAALAMIIRILNGKEVVGIIQIEEPNK